MPNLKPLVVANWKCNPVTLKEAKRLFNSVKRGIKNVKNTEIVICPPFIYLADLRASAFAKGFGGLAFGSQDCFWEERGAYTGEVSPKMLKDLGVEYVIIGHSERRRYLKETDEMINRKIKAAIIAGLKPILCIGSRERGNRGSSEMKIQLQKALAGVKKTELKNVIITYEPVWAISTTKRSVIATPENTKEGKIFIRENLNKLFGKSLSQRVRVIYGGSVDSNNIEGFIKVAKMDGVLIGAASLKPDDFTAAVKKIDLISKTW